MTTKAINPEDLLNTRIRIKGEPPAFIRFVGKLPRRKAIYIGLQWDDDSRGKSESVVDDEVIFTPAPKKSVDFEIQANQFSSFTFMKWSLIQDKIHELQQDPSQILVQFDTASTIMDAIQDRYMEKVGDGVIEWRETRNVELVGMEKVSRKYFHHLDRLNVVAANHQGISRIGDLSALTSMETLDLSCNLFSTWREIMKIFPQSPKLKELILSGNRFCDWDDLFSIASEMKNEKQFPPYNLETLVLNASIAQWNDATLLIKYFFPKLKELHLCDNKISKLVPASGIVDKEDIHIQLENLDLMNNEIENWNEICELAVHLPSLRRLNLRKNPIDRIVVSQPESTFPKLESLSLEDSRISSWNDIDTLNRFPSLNDLRIQETPLEAKEGRATTRIFTIARVKKLTSLNGSAISEKERQDAEKYYLKYCADLRLQAKEKGSLDEELFKSQNPRYMALCEQYGSYEEFVKKEYKQDYMKQLLVPVLIRNMASSTVGADTLQMEKKVSSTMRVIDLKKLCQRKWKIPVDIQRLYFTPDPQDLFPEELDDDEQTLSFYGIRVGGMILVEERDLKKEAEEKDRKKVEQMEKEARYSEHLKRMEMDF